MRTALFPWRFKAVEVLRFFWEGRTRICYNPFMALRFAVVTDIHYGFDINNKKGSKAPKLMDRFVKVANGNGVDFSVDMGDRVILKTPADDAHYLKQLTHHFNQRSGPHYSINGNHDLKNLSRADNAAILGYSPESQLVDVGDYNLILWSPNVNGRDGDGYLSAWASHIDWFRDALTRATKPCIVFSHVPLDNSAADDEYIEKNLTNYFPAFYREGKDIRKMMEDSGKVILCMAGHRHRNQHHEINGIHYITQQSLVQRHTVLGRAIGAFSLVTIDDASIRITGYGIRQPSFLLSRATNTNTPPGP